MEREVPQNTLGLPLLTLDSNQQDFLPTHIWHRRHDPVEVEKPSMQEHATKSPVHVTHSEWHLRKSMPLSLQYVLPTVSDTYARAQHYVFSTYHSMSDAYARAQHYDSSICHSLNDMYAKARHTRDTYKACQTQAMCLVSLNGSSNPRSVLGKPRRSYIGFSKPRANASSV